MCSARDTARSRSKSGSNPARGLGYTNRSMHEIMHVPDTHSHVCDQVTTFTSSSVTFPNSSIVSPEHV